MSQGRQIRKGASAWARLDATRAAGSSDQSSQLFKQAEHVVESILRRLGVTDETLEDHRQDIFVSLLRRLTGREGHNDDHIEKFEAYAAQTTFNHVKRNKHHKRELSTQTLSATDLGHQSLTDGRPTHADTLVISKVIKRVWQECIRSMSTEQLAIFLFDRNDILWQLISIEDPISLDQIAAALGLQTHELEKIIHKLPCKSDRELAELIGMTEERIHKLRHRMKPLIRRIRAQVLC